QPARAGDRPPAARHADLRQPDARRGRRIPRRERGRCQGRPARDPDAHHPHLALPAGPRGRADGQVHGAAAGGREVPRDLHRRRRWAAVSAPAPSPAAGGVGPVRPAGGGAPPPLICTPSVVAVSGPPEYAKLAAGLPGTRTVLALPWPGFGDGEPVPADLASA